MAHIKLKDGKVIKTTPEKARKLDEAYKSPSMRSEQTISVDGITFTKAMIAYVATSDEDDASSSKKSAASDHLKEMVRKQHAEFEQMLALTPESRAMVMDFFSFYFFSLTFRKPNEEECAKARIAQEEYFTEHDHVYAHPKIFHGIITESNPDAHIGGYQKELSGLCGQLFILGAKYVRKSEYARK